ncbi:hypothetical protein RFI_05822 [Reticulomyxa filosa]|uniref:Uncharacterized protein n=1 Tax=Reticulomyxa filosa TaxID=46433 RepID=X6NYA1_RETFI|nr:hypothetical protein RFI_05822 [Reticulomyxa filosa]|eukprot:ETO31300.1 hypothetical protein RFI_05822 [Reticulomyxa filosa]
MYHSVGKTTSALAFLFRTKNDLKVAFTYLEESWKIESKVSGEWKETWTLKEKIKDMSASVK